MRIIIAGGRNFNDYELLKKEVILFIKENNLKKSDIVIVSGMAKGADSLGVRFAEEYGLTINKYPANWALYGKSAGFIRNNEMGQNADACICFWDRISSGTKNMISISEEKKLITKIVYFSTENEEKKLALLRAQKVLKNKNGKN